MDLRKIQNNDYLFKQLCAHYSFQGKKIMDKNNQIFVGHLLRLQRSVFQYSDRESNQAKNFIDMIEEYIEDNQIDPQINERN